MPARRRLCSALTAASLTLCGLATAITPPAIAAGSGEFCGPGWQRISTPAVQQHSSLADVDGVAGDLWAVGEHHRQGRGEQTFAIHWDGQSWSTTDTVDRADPFATQLDGVAVVAHADVWAVGSSTFTDGATRFFAERWTGSTWSATPTPDVTGPGEQLLAVDGIAAGDAWAVGTRGSDSERTAVLHWDGAAWSVVPSPNPGTGANVLWGVAAVSPTQAWAFGGAADRDGTAVPLVLRWNGIAWSVVAEADDLPDDAYLLDGEVAPDGDVWTAGGAPWSSGAVHQSVLQHREGGTWTTRSVGGEKWQGISPVSDSDVWLTGFTTTAHWDGSSVTPLSFPPARGDSALGSLRAVQAVGPHEVWTVGWSDGWTEQSTIPVAMRLCPLQVTDDGIEKESSRVSQGSGTIWRFPAANDTAHDVTDALDLGTSSTPLFGTGRRSPGSTGTFTLNHAGTFPVVDTATGHTSELTVPTEAMPKSAPLGTTFTVYTAATTSSLGSSLGSDIRYRKPGSEFWYRLASGTRSAQTAFTPDQKGTYTFQARLRNRTTGVVSGWSPFATVKVTAT